ncbi:MAG: GIY-YIG nuclease family protein [Minisyncoccia bacterium]
MKFNFLQLKNIEKLPNKSGVYAFLNENNQFLYIGKAKNIKKRVLEHFKETSFRDTIFIKKVKKVGFLITNSEIEALILEANLIKKIKPLYNIVWKDNKNYFFVAITKEKKPRLFITHQIEKRKNEKSKIEYIGPFVDGTSLKKTIFLLRKLFPFRSCKILPKKPCLFYDLKLCPGICKKDISNKEILKAEKINKNNIKKIAEILKGKSKNIFLELKKEILMAIKEENFEKAKEIKDKFFAFEKILLNSKIIQENNYYKDNYFKIEKELRKILKIKNKISRIEAYDVSNIQGKEATASMVVFINGKTSKEDYRKFKIRAEGKPNDFAMLKEAILRRFSHKEWAFPDLILVDGGKGQLSAALKCKNYNFETKKIKIIALAKKKNELFIENQKEPILLKKLSIDLANLILRIRDEAHRFAIFYHRKLREKKLT